MIIGCGITGLAIARELVGRGEDDILVIDKEPGAGVHASGRNSGVLHSGIYYSPGSLKARFCAEGNKLLSLYCKDKDLSLDKCGKVIVATDNEELQNLMLLYERAERNNVKCNLVNEKELSEIEPYARTFQKALYSPNTAVFDPVEILNSLIGDLTSSGKVRFLFDTAFISRNNNSGVRTTSGTVQFKKMINCAGAFADTVANEYGAGMQYRILPFLGTYKKLRKQYSYLVRSNIYPVPDLRNPFLGVHFTRARNGSVYIGPTAIPAPGRESYELLSGINMETPSIIYREIILFLVDRAFRDNAINEIKKYLSHYVYREARKMLPDLRLSYIENSGRTGIRPQLVDWENKKLVDDFLVLNDDYDNVHVLNAISPAFTSSMAFARYVVDKYIEG